MYMKESFPQLESKNPTPEQKWAESESMFSKIYGTGVKKYLEGLPSLTSAFHKSDLGVRCIDEGTPSGIHMAGSGIILSTAEKIDELRRVEEELKRAGVDGVYSHEGCGAAALYAETVAHDPNNAHKYAVEWAQKLAKELGVDYKGHIDKLARPKDFHNARIAYYDATGEFDPFKIKEIPDGFIISRHFLDPMYSKEELGIALSIAMGHHGFGDKFSKDKPFIIAPIQMITNEKRPDLELQALEAEARAIAAPFGDRVIVEGFRIKK
ncbi:MAG: hypothetical protein HY225_04155 [Candidatus Vogelbacteria bacterium]|nr:hypothetical protein [Candidatus Vogelbacteria bacterium]